MGAALHPGSLPPVLLSLIFQGDTAGICLGSFCDSPLPGALQVRLFLLQGSPWFAGQGGLNPSLCPRDGAQSWSLSLFPSPQRAGTQACLWHTELSEGWGMPSVNESTKLQGEKSGKEQTQRRSRGFHCRLGTFTRSWLTPVTPPCSSAAPS